VSQREFNSESDNGEAQISSSANLDPQIVSAARRGWRLHPLRERDKRPLLKNWPLIATSDLIQLSNWLQMYPGCNWGAVCGPDSEFFAVDVDKPEAMRRLEDEYGPLPEGLCTVTARGYALIYRWPANADICPNTNRPCKGIDIRGRGSYIVIPPSIHPSGHQYLYSDDSLQIAECPAWLLALILKNQSLPWVKEAEAAGEGEFNTIGPGKRTPILASLTGKLVSLGVPLKGIEAAVTALNSTFSPPHSPEKVQSIVGDMVGRYPAGDRRRVSLNLLRGAEIADQEDPWILKNHIPDRTVFGIHGRPGDGKSVVSLLIGADLSKGRTPMTGQSCAPRNVLILSNEDSPARIRRLFAAMGGDLNRLFVENIDDAWWLGDLARLGHAIEEVSAGYVVIDSLASHSGKADLNSHGETTNLLVPLRALAEQYNCTIAVIHHLNKTLAWDHIQKVAGSIGITASFRHNLHVVPDPDDAALRLLINGKTNLAPPNISALRFTVLPCGWRGEAALAIDEAYIIANDSEVRSGRAVAWLLDALRDGEWHDAGNLQRQAESGFNLSRRSIFRAAEKICVERRKEGFGGRASWRTPPQGHIDAPTWSPSGTHGTDGKNGDLRDLQHQQSTSVPYMPTLVEDRSAWHSWESACGGLLQ
jgi:hypothetical protein